jgi:hypothetical protein
VSRIRCFLPRITNCFINQPRLRVSFRDRRDDTSAIAQPRYRDFAFRDFLFWERSAETDLAISITLETPARESFQSGRRSSGCLMQRARLETRATNDDSAFSSFSRIAMLVFRQEEHSRCIVAFIRRGRLFVRLLERRAARYRFDVSARRTSFSFSTLSLI